MLIEPQLNTLDDPILFKPGALSAELNEGV